MKRLDGWRPAFIAAIDAHRPHAFGWGSHDCAILTADCILAVTGMDPAENFRGRYDSAESAKAALAEAGFDTAVDVVAQHFAEIHPSQAIVGDIAVIPTRQGPATAPVMGAELAAYAGNGILGAVPLADAVRAFRIEIV
jgi:hypothetical protein